MMINTLTQMIILKSFYLYLINFDILVKNALYGFQSNDRTKIYVEILKNTKKVADFCLTKW